MAAGLHIQRQAGPVEEEVVEEEEVGTPCWVGVSLSCGFVVQLRVKSLGFADDNAPQSV